MSIYDAIANGGSRVPNIAQAVMQGQQTRFQRDMAPLQRQQAELAIRQGEQQLAMGDIQLEAARNPAPDFGAMLEQTNAQNEMVYNILSGVGDEQTYQQALPTLRRIAPDAPDTFDPEWVQESRGNAARWRENQTTIGKAFADAQALAAQGRTDEARALLEQTLQPPERQSPNLQRITALVNGEENPSSLSYDPADGRHFRVVDGERQYLNPDQFTPVNVTGGRGDVLPPNRADDVQAQLDWTEFGISEIGNMIDKIEADPAIVGLSGGARRFIRTWSGMAEDLGQMFGRAGANDARDVIEQARNAALRDLNSGSMDQEAFTSLFGNADLDEVPLFENALTYMLARTWVPDGRLLAQTVNAARDSVNITGVRSSEQAINNLNYVRRQMESRRDSLTERLGEETSGQSTTRPTFRWNRETNTLERNGG